MSLNLIDLIKGQLSPELISNLSRQLGESESGISKAISGLLPAVVGGLAEKSSDSSLLDIIKNPESTNILGNLLGAGNNPLVSRVINFIFGDKLNGVLSGISAFSGIETSKVNSLLGVVTGASVGSVSKLANDYNLDLGGITNLMDSQKDEVSSLLPAGFSLGALGLGGLLGGITGKVGDLASGVADVAGNVTGKVGDLASEAADKVGDVAGNVTEAVGDLADEAKKGGSSLLKWALPLLLLAGGGWFMLKQCGGKKPTETVVASTSDSTLVAEGDTVSSTAERVLEELELNGMKLKAYAGGLESQLIKFLQDGSYQKLSDDELKEKWYDFDNVTFVFGKSNEITEESKGQLENLATILKAYPDAKIKIGGYTDKKGSEEGNKKMSQDRADFIKAELTKLGVGSQVAGAEGYGEEFATVDENASDEERAKDRKMSIRFTK